MRPPLPGQRVLDAVGRRAAPAGRVAGEPVGQTDRRVEVDRVAALIAEARGSVAEVGAEVGRAPLGRDADSQFVHHVLRQRRTEGERGQRPPRVEVAVVRRAREADVGVVQIIGIAFGPEDRVRAAETMVVAEVVVDLDGRLVFEEPSRAQPLVGVHERIARFEHAAAESIARRRRLDARQQRRDGRVDRGDLAALPREVEDVDFPRLSAHRVAEPAVERARMQHVPRTREAVREAELLVVHHVERLAAAVEQSGDHERAAGPRAVLIELDVVLRQLRLAVVVEEVVGVHARMPPVVVGGSAEPVGAGARREVDADRAAPAHRRAADRRDHRHRFDGVLPRRHRGEERVARAQEVVVVVDAVHRDLDERLGQTVDARLAVGRRRVDTREKRDGVQRVARRRGHAVQLVRVQRRGNSRRLRVDQFRTALDRDRLADLTDLEYRLDAGRSTRQHANVYDGSLEAGERDGHLIGSGSDRRDIEDAFRVGNGLE